MSQNRNPNSSRALRDRIVGRTITGVVARPGREGEPPMVMMMQFEDGSVVEFVSPRSDAVLKSALNRSRRPLQHPAAPGPDQLALAVM
jgi:hypothetical protein